MKFLYLSNRGAVKAQTSLRVRRLVRAFGAARKHNKMGVKGVKKVRSAVH